MIFGRLLCKLLGRHRWGRAYMMEPLGRGLVKRCRRCGLIRSVKRRAAKIDQKLADALARNFGETKSGE